jgi:multimeric flavodoxin WrbA
MPLCHWPCSCYPNHASGQTNDWMAEIYELWVRAHGVLLLTPVHWYQVTSPLKLMMDRLVCADGGNPDPTSTQGKKAQLARDIELNGWDYPQHLAGRVYGVVVHGDVAGIDSTRRALSDWLDWMGLVDAGAGARLERYIGYYEPYATSHEALDADTAVQDEVGRAARAVSIAVGLMRDGRLRQGDEGLPKPRTK